MDERKLISNLEKLNKIIPSKPKFKTSNFPVSIGESLRIYLRQSTISNIRVASWIYDRNDWPIPFYVDPSHIKVGFLNRIVLAKLGKFDFKYYDMFFQLTFSHFEESQVRDNLFYRLFVLLRKTNEVKYYDWFNIPVLANSFKITNLDDLIINLFDVNSKYVFNRLIGNPIFVDKQIIIKDIFSNYQHKNYSSCICTLYPLLDYCVRVFCNTSRLERDITYINAIFKKAGFSLNDIDNLKPGAHTQKTYNSFRKGELSREQFNKSNEKYDLGLPGIALSSFLHFGSKYYSFYRKEDVDKYSFNRHAIIHGANDNYYTKVNAVKLFTFLYLTLELEPVLKIVLNEN